MKIAYNPIGATALTKVPDDYVNDILFDLVGLNIFAKGTKFKGTDTTYLIFKKHTSDGKGGYNGLVPVPSYTTTNIRYLREDGTWLTPSTIYTQLGNVDLNTLTTEGKWYYTGGASHNTNVPSGFNNGSELYVGRHAHGWRYLKAITSAGTVWYRSWDGNAKTWTAWTRWYTDQNTDSKVLLSPSTTSNFRPIVLGHRNSTDTSVLDDEIALLVYTTAKIYALPSTGTLFATKFQGALDWNSITNKPTSFTPSAHTHTSDQITALTGYTKSTSDSALTTTDSLNVALGKLEYKGDLGVSAYNIVKAAYDGDGTIENLNEILKVLQGIKDTDTITGILANYVTLNTTLTIVGEKTFSSLLKSTVATGTAPLSVTSTTVNTNLNADLLDGYHGTDYLRSFWTTSPGYDCSIINLKSIVSFTYTNNSPFRGGFIDVSTNNYGFYLGTDYDLDNPLYYRRHGGDRANQIGNWQQLARITDNVASATKLLNKRYLWGQLFDGTLNVSGTLTDVANIIMSGLILRTGEGGGWYRGRDYAAVRITTYSGYNSILSMKTTNGSWELGAYLNDIIHLVYITDTNYNSGTNTRTYNIQFPKKTGTIALTGDISNHYWANIKVSTTSNENTTPIFGNTTINGGLVISGGIQSGGTTSGVYLGCAANGLGSDYTGGLMYSYGGPLYFHIKGNCIAFIGTNGNVGIGTTSPILKLHVTGNILAEKFIKAGGTASLVLMADGSIQNHYKAADVTSATSDNGMITPLAMNLWTSRTYVTSLDTSGLYLTWTKNGTTNNITIPYARYTSYVDHLDNRSDNLAPYGSWAYKGIQYSLKYNSADGLGNGGTYHGSMTLHQWHDKSGGAVHQLGFTDNGNMWMRYGTDSWSAWRRFMYADEAVTSLGTNGTYLTWTKNGATNNITVPYAYTSTCLNTGWLSGANSHADNLKAFFNANEASIPRNVGLSYYSSAYRNGSQYFGYFLSGYNSNPYGGFFVAHYDNPYYVGIVSGTYSQQHILTDTNYTAHLDSRYVNVTGDTMTGPLVISTGTLNGSYNEGIRLTAANNNWTGITFGSTGTSGAPTNGWFVARNPSNQFIISPSDSNNTTGLTLKNGGNALWRNNVIWHAGNDGAGSGLDADLLDGYHESAFVRDRLIGSKGDYQDVVILLWKDSDVTTHRIVGKLFTTSGGASRWQYADINFWFSRWSSGSERKFLMNTDALGANFRLVTCTYLGATWWALRHTNIQAVTFHFQGTSSNISWQKVHYYTLNTGTVVNSEIRNSLQNKDSLISSSLKGGFIAYATLNDNVASSTKLLNTRTLWGLPFNGELNVSGNMTGVGSFTGVGQFKYGSTDESDATYGKYHRLNLGYHGIDHTDFYENVINFYTNGGAYLYAKFSNSESYFRGNVGIGITPSYKLHVAGSIMAENEWLRTSGATGWYNQTYGGGIWMKDNTWIRTYGGKKFYCDNASVDSIQSYGGFFSNGKDGHGLTIIGTESTTTRIKGQIGSSADLMIARYEVQWYDEYARIDVHRGGSVDIKKWSFKHNNTEVVSISMTGNIYATHFYEYSDIRYKTVLNNLSIKANQIANIPLFDFKWKDNEDLLNTGTSAQAVQEILPYLVSGKEKLTLNYGVLGTIAGVIACKELTELEKEIEKLKDRVEELENKLTLFNSRF